MLCRDIYLAAVGMTGEDMSDDCLTDYEDCSVYLLATCCRECASIDARYRAAHAMEPASIPRGVYIDLEDDFPLCDALVPAVTYYLAAMLVADENEELSDRFFSLYTDSLAALSASIPASHSSVRDCYGLLK